MESWCFVKGADDHEYLHKGDRRQRHMGIRDSRKGAWVVVTVNQKETIRLPLDQDQKTHVKGPIGLTEIEVKNGHARIIRSPCKNKVCIKSGYIRYADRLAACIPNRVVIRIVGKSNRGVDAVIG